MTEAAPLQSLPLAQAESLAERIVSALAPHCRRLEIAGSIRRRRAHVGDIDLVCIPAGLDGRRAIMARCAQTATLQKEGEQYVEFRLANGFQLDLWFAHEGGADLLEPDPGNWGILLLARTGSAMHNVYLASQAKSLHLRFNPHRGILRGRQVIASEREDDVFRALNLSYVAPEARER